MSKKMGIPLSSSDIEDLQNGVDFQWTFNGIDVHVFNEDLVPVKCPRCIEDYQDDEGKEKKGTSVESDCTECGVCSECEHLLECSNST